MKIKSIVSLCALLIVPSMSLAETPKKMEVSEPDLNGAVEMTGAHVRAFVIVLQPNDILNAKFVAVKPPKDFECVTMQHEPVEEVLPTEQKGATCKTHVVNATAKPMVIIFVGASEKSPVKGKFSYTLTNADT